MNPTANPLPNPLIDEADVNTQTLCAVLNRALMTPEVRAENSIYIHEPDMFPFWIDIKPEPRFLLLNTYLTWADSATESQRLAFCNQINETTYLPGACDHVIERDEGIERRLTLGYPIYFRDGLLERQFIRLCRLFSRGVQRIQVEMDTDKLVA